ncbi:hypothetical protein GGI20_003685 [Coemansia sp. BCRC 34301]|nr:hypothetical protein GGI20_003685 [Coemansia sp. BCRC 34301]
MSASSGNYMHNFGSTALLSAASTAALSQGHSSAAIATAQSALSSFVTSMDWSHKQEPGYSPGSAVRKATIVDNGRADAERGSANQYSLSAVHDRVKSGGVQKPRALAGRSYTVSPSIANNCRGSSSGASSEHDEEDDENNINNSRNMADSSAEQQRRRRFLERNRVAASKCRQKKKMWIQDLERRADDVTMQNRSLHIAVAQLKEEVLILKNQLLAHSNCGCSAVQQFIHPDPSCSIDPARAAVTAAAIAATAAGVFPITSSPTRQHHIVHPSAASSSLLFQAPPPHQPLLYSQPQHNAYHHASSVDRAAMGSDSVVTSSAVNSFVGNMPSQP